KTPEQLAAESEELRHLLSADPNDDNNSRRGSTSSLHEKQPPSSDASNIDASDESGLNTDDRVKLAAGRVLFSKLDPNTNIGLQFQNIINFVHTGGALKKPVVSAPTASAKKPTSSANDNKQPFAAVVKNGMEVKPSSETDPIMLLSRDEA